MNRGELIPSHKMKMNKMIDVIEMYDPIVEIIFHEENASG